MRRSNAFLQCGLRSLGVKIHTFLSFWAKRISLWNSTFVSFDHWHSLKSSLSLPNRFTQPLLRSATSLFYHKSHALHFRLRSLATSTTVARGLARLATGAAEQIAGRRHSAEPLLCGETWQTGTAVDFAR